MIQHLIWDVDGTLFDTYPALTRSFSMALRELGVTLPLDSDWITGLARQSLGQCVTTLAGKFNLSLEEVQDRFWQNYRSISPQDQPPFAGVMEVCETIRSTGGTNVIASHRGKASILGLLKAHGMTQYFQDYLAGDDPFPKKPDPAVFVEMIRRHQFKREETLAIGDRDIDILAGQAAGVRTCLFGSASSEVSPDCSITDYADLQRLILAENSRQQPRQ